MHPHLKVTKPLRLIVLLCTFFAILAGCVSKPSKAPSIAADRIQALRNQALPSRLPIPVEGVSKKQLHDTWGAARSSGRSHEGIDIMAATGTKVYSATDGIVSSLKGNNLGGTVVWITGPAGSWHYYAHLDRHKRGLKEGDFVKKGDLIGYVGYSGNASKSAPHLHYGIYLTGKGRGATNPYPYLK